MLRRINWVLVALGVLLFCLSWPLPLWAQQNMELDGKGTEASIAVPEALQENNFYYISRDNLSVPIVVNLRGPAGTSAELWAAPLKGTVESTLQSTRGWYQLKPDKKLAIPAAAVVPATAAAATTCEMPDALYEQFANILRVYLGRQPTREEVCQYFGGGPKPTPTPGGPVSTPPPGSATPIPGYTPGPGYTPTPSYTSVSATAFLEKNTCASRKSRYLVLLKVTSSAGGTVSASMFERRHTGKKAAALKPKSDGKYAPHPIILMTSNGWGWGAKETLLFTRWTAKGPSRIGTLKVDDYVYYKGLNLTKVVIDSVLKGGRATIGLTNGSNGYSICMNLVRVRQQVNGYPR